MNYELLMTSFKQLTDEEKMIAIKEFLIKDIETVSTINKNIGNDKELPNTNVTNYNELDNIYELLHIMTNEVESFANFVENTFYEDV